MGDHAGPYLAFTWLNLFLVARPCVRLRFPTFPLWRRKKGSLLRPFQGGKRCETPPRACSSFTVPENWTPVMPATSCEQENKRRETERGESCYCHLLAEAQRSHHANSYFRGLLVLLCGTRTTAVTTRWWKRSQQPSSSSSLCRLEWFCGEVLALGSMAVCFL